MSKGLEALKRLGLKDFILNDESSLKDINDIYKELKALEIIKNALGIHLVETIGNKYYIEITGEDMIGLCKENYCLLKEIL